MSKWVKMYVAQRSIVHTISTKMPAMLRLPGKGKKIAWNILGKPANMQSKKTAEQDKLDKEIYHQEASRVK